MNRRVGRVNLDTVRADYNCLNNILPTTVNGNASRRTEDAEKSLYRWRARRERCNKCFVPSRGELTTTTS
jgi:hypothetical protein